MKVLVACECSGRVKTAFRERGHDAWSCDLKPSEIPDDKYHIQGDVLNHLNDDWDLMIAHPDCRLFANAGLHYLKTRPGRQQEQEQQFLFVKALWDAPIEKIAIENPIGWLNTHWQKPSEIIQPYWFGERELKTTCLWLKNLPPLMATLVCETPKPMGSCIRKTGNRAGDKYNYYFRQGKSATDRARTFQGIAQAMAEQWGSLKV